MAVSYTEFVDRMSVRKPCLKDLSAFLEKAKSAESQASHESIISHMEVNTVGEASLSKKTTIDDLSLTIQSLSEQPQHTTSGTAKGLFIAVENMHPTDVETLGSLLDVDPLFFCSHLTASHRDVEKKVMPPLLGLPSSRLASHDYFNIHYQRVLHLGEESTLCPLPYELTIPGNCPRTVRRLPALSGRLLGLARACCSVFKKDLDNGLILVDSTTADMVAQTNTKSTPTKATISIPQVPRRIAVEDFLDIPTFSSFRDSGGTAAYSRNPSLREDILGLVRHTPPPNTIASKEKGMGSPNILSLCYYPLRIALSEWMLYALLMSRYSKFYEYSFKTMQNRINHFEHEDILELHRWRRRSKQTLHKLHVTKTFVEYHSQDAKITSWEGQMAADLSYVAGQVGGHAQALEALGPIITSLVQLIDSRRSISEAVDVRRLTYIALIFIPLSLISAIFSMGGDYAVGESRFWVYWATALPVAAVVLLLSTVPINNFLTGAASWMTGKKKVRQVEKGMA